MAVRRISLTLTALTLLVSASVCGLTGAGASAHAVRAGAARVHRGQHRRHHRAVKQHSSGNPANSKPSAAGTPPTVPRPGSTQFDWTIAPHQTRSATLGAFTLTETNSGSGCGGLSVSAGAPYVLSVGSAQIAGPYTGSKPVGTPNSTTTFEALLESGASYMSGSISQSDSGGKCVTSGVLGGY